MATGSTETAWLDDAAARGASPPPPPAPPPGIDEATLMAAARAAVGLAPPGELWPDIDHQPRPDDTVDSPEPAQPEPAPSAPAQPAPAQPAPAPSASAVTSSSRLRAAGRLTIIVVVAAGIAAALASWVSVSVLGGDRTEPSPPSSGVFSGESVDDRDSPDAVLEPGAAPPDPALVVNDAERAFIEAVGVRYTWASDTGRAADVTVERRTGDLIVRFDDGTRFRQLGGIWEQQDDAGTWRTLEPAEAPPVDVSRLAPTSGAMRPSGAVPSAFDPFTLSRESEINAVGNQVIRLTLDDISLNRHDVELRAFWMERWGLDPAVVSVAPLSITMVVTPEGFVRSMRINLTAFETGIDYGLVDLYDEPPRLEF